MSVEEFDATHHYLLNLVGEYEHFNNEDFVPVISELVSAVKNDMELRYMVIGQTNWMNLIMYLPKCFKNIESTQNISPSYVRLVNAILLYCRIIVCVESTNNLGQEALENLYEVPKHLINAFTVLSNTDLKDGIFERIIETLAMVTQLLPNYKLGLELNLTLGLDIDANVENDVSNIITFLEYSVNFINNKKLDDLMLLMYFNNVVAKNDTFLQYALRQKPFREEVLEKFFLIDVLNTDVFNSIIAKGNNSENVEELLNMKELKALQTLKKILTHESITPYFETKLKNQDYDMLLNWSRISSTLICSSAIFDTFQLTNIMIWVFMILENISTLIIRLFDNHKISNTSESFIDQELIPKTDFYYEILFNSLDILSHLCQFEHCQKFVLHYKGIEKLGKLLGTLQVNCYKLSVHINDKENGKLTLNDNLKKNTDYNNWLKVIDKVNNKIKSINFPHTKSLIIEILTKFLVLDKESDDNLKKLKDLQDLLKAESILEIVLGNCVIDDNEPFIKERSIMFLKYALYKNQTNQEFVAKLEQRTEVDSQSETLLEEVGYEVNISDNGKIGLKRKNSNSLN